ncbi:MAG TPA: hypothetical protein VHQ20_02285 [Patescibacteria group bacterium]|jgi:hypothetical protein|nr:hypothetical protein [Patescibacteria group bacterium]
MNIDEAQGFVEANKRLITETNKLARCVDGRYENIEDIPMIAKPGADAGDVMAAFGALNLLQQTLPSGVIFDIVAQSIGGVQNFRFHTDDHAGDAIGMGCGHIKQAKLDPTAYGLQQDQIDFIFDQLPGVLVQGAWQEVLHGDHAEQAVVVVDSENYGVLPLLRSADTLQEAFIYQKTIHAQQLAKISKLMQENFAEQGVVVEEPQILEALNNAFGKQLGETLKRLAKDLPIYTAKINAEGAVELSA